MDPVVKSLLERPQPQTRVPPLPRPSREEAEAAVRVLLRWAGDDPTREGLVDTPKRVVRAYEELFSGTGSKPDVPQGWQRKSRARPSQPPAQRPCRDIASSR